MANSYDDWITHIFDNRVVSLSRYSYLVETDTRWVHRQDAQPGSAMFLSYTTQAFENAEAVFKKFSDGQLNQGLWYLASPGAGEYIYPPLNASVPLPDPLRWLRSFYTLYEQLFQKRCTPHLSSLDREENKLISPLNSICYMWYDVIPIYGKPEDPARTAIDKTCVEVLAKTLSLSNIACQEAALHGLGHWQDYYPNQVIPIIDKFLTDNAANNSKISLELRRYARQAREGMVM